MTYSIDVLVKEHENIKRMVRVIRSICFQIMETKKVPYEDMEHVIDFVKNYADVHHHGKEEKILFASMQKHLGRMGENLITHGMLVEHDLGRLHMQELNAALKRVKEGDQESLLDVIANAISYTHLIERHIKKEDELVYPFGEKQLEALVLEQVDEETKTFEEEAQKKNTQKYYEKMIDEMEEKYLK